MRDSGGIMRVRFLVDFRGVPGTCLRVNEQFYVAGTEADFDTSTATALIADGRAEAVDQDTPKKGK